jgi:hypothetical protein
MTTLTATNLLTTQPAIKIGVQALVQPSQKDMQPVITQTPTAEINVSLTSSLSENEVARLESQLKFALQQNSPQELNALYESRVDQRVNVYEKNGDRKFFISEAYVDKATRSIYSGKAEGETVEALNELLARISQGAEQAHNETRSILSELSKLTPATESYISESQSYTRFALDKLGSVISPDEPFTSATGNKKSFALQVTTKQGDIIDIKINQANQWDDLTSSDQIKVSYQVEGDLSEAEHQALTDLMAAIGGASDSLLAGTDLTKLMGIDTFNGEQLANFSLSLSGSGQQVNYKYQHDEDNQYLEGSWIQKGVNKASFDLISKFGGNSHESQLAQYLTLIEEASDSSFKFNLDEREKDQSSGLFKNTFTDFMQLAERLGASLEKADKVFDQSRTLANTLFTKMQNDQENRLGLEDEHKARIKEGFNLLTDFSANFSVMGGGSASKGYIEPSTGYQLSMKQKTKNITELTPEGSQQAIKQKRDISFDGIMSGINEREHKLNEQYQVSAVIADFSLQAMKQNRESTEHLREKLYHGMGDFSFREEDRDTESNNSLYFLKEGSLELNKLIGEESFTKGLMAGDKITWEMEGSESYDIEQRLLIEKDKDYRDAASTAMSIASQKKLIDELFELLE